MGREKCRSCTHYVLQYSYLANGYVEGCDIPDGGNEHSCEGHFENKKKKIAESKKAFIKRR